MLTVAEALAAILDQVRPLPPHSVPLEAAAGHILARDAVAAFDLPSFPNSAMDGFAVRAANLETASATSPVHLKLVGEIKAGDAPTAMPPGSVCVRIMTGAPVPEGADAVVMKEETAAGPTESIVFRETPPADENIRLPGRDIAAGQHAVKAGALIRPPEMAMLAALGLSPVSVFPRPRLAIFTTGDEVVPVGSAAGPGQIYNSNRYMLQALAENAGFNVTLIHHLPDDPEETKAQMEAAAPVHDAMISCGGVSVGEHDHIRSALDEVGVIHFWRVAMKPGKPLAFGAIGECLFFGLPGNPVSSLVSFELFVRPALLRMAGHHKIRRPRIRSRLLSSIYHRVGREEYVRVMTLRQGDEFVSRPSAGQESHMVSSLVSANSLAVIPAEAGSIPESARVDVLMTEWPEE